MEMTAEVIVAREGPELEIAAWQKVLPKDISSRRDISLDDLESVIRDTSNPDDPPGWKEQPLYGNEILRRFMRGALMHENLSSDKQHASNSFVQADEFEVLIRSKFPNRSDVQAFHARLGKRNVVFMGVLGDDSSVECLGLYLSASPTDFRPVSDIHELLQVFGVQETKESVEIITSNVLSQLEHEKFVREQMPQNVNAWLSERSMGRPDSIARFIQEVDSRFSPRVAAFELNNFFEGTMLQRHPGQHAYVNELDAEFRASSLRPVPLVVVDLPKTSVQHVVISGADGILLKANNQVRMFLHPTTYELLQRLRPDLKAVGGVVAEIFPSVGGRSGNLKVDDQWMDYQIKFDVPRRISGWLRICGQSAVKEETEAAALIQKHFLHGHMPPQSVVVMPTMEGVTYEVGTGKHIATLVRPIPKTIQEQILIPAAYLYTQDPFGSTTFLAELLSAIESDKRDEFFINRLVHPIMEALNYFYSLEDPEHGENGLAYEMHGANFYFEYDAENASLTGRVVTKDFASNRILSTDPKKEDVSQNWLLDTYDHGLGYLYLNPLVAEMSRISGKPTTHYDALVREAFSRKIEPKNKAKFLVKGDVVGMHQDVYHQLEHRDAPREKRWATKPRFRPHERKLYK